MALKKMISQLRLLTISSKITNRRAPWPRAAVLDKSTLDPGDSGLFKRYIPRRTESRPFLLAGEKLLGMDTARFDGQRQPETTKLTAADAGKILRTSQMERLRSELRRSGRDCISYSEFMKICVRESSDEDRGVEFARMLDESGSVIVLGNIVFLRPEKVVKAIQDLLIPTTTSPKGDDPKTNALREMEIQKATIEAKAEQHVRRELWSGLAFLVVQTSLFVRLTFWELSWDVMEPICFFVTTVYFMGSYTFFLTTSKEPSFEGLYRSRLSVRRRRLMEVGKFDVERYNELKKACYSQPLFRN